MTLALDPVDRFLAELRAAQDDASLSSLAVTEGTFDEFESADFVVNNLPAIRYALAAGMPITAWAPAQKNPNATEKVLRAIRQFEEQAKLLVLAYTQGLISLEQFRAALVRVFHSQARNSYIAGRRAVGDLAPLTPQQEREFTDAVTEDEDDLDTGLSLDPTVAAGGGLAAMLGAMLFDPSNYLGSGLPGDPLAGLPAPIGAGKISAEKQAAKAMTKFTTAMSGKGDAIRSMSHVGELSALAGLPGDATLVWWTLGYADHCIDCVRLADGSPYYISVMNNNGLFPGSGHTRCGGRCRCSMEYDVPSEACSDGLAIVDGDPGDLSAVLESADGRKLNVWIMEAAACKLPVSIGSLNPMGSYGTTIDDADAFAWDEDIAQIMSGSIETTTHTWAEVIANAGASARARDIQKAFGFIAADLKHLTAELRLTEYEASGSRYVMAWRKSGDTLVFHAGTTLKGSTVLEPEFTLRALNDLAARAAAEKLSITVSGDYLGSGFRSWLSTLGAQQLVGTPLPPTVVIDWTKLGGELVLPVPTTPDAKLLDLLKAQPIEQAPVVEWDSAAAMIDDLTARYPGAQFDDLAKLDFELVKPAMEQMDAVFQRFGAIESFRGVRVTGLPQGVVASVKRLDKSKPGSAIFLPKATWGDRAALETHLATQTSSSFSTATAVLAKDAADTEGYTKAIITHELGHEYMGVSLFSRFGNKGDGIRREVDVWFKGAQKADAHGGFLASLKAAHLSKYADANPHEAWAEAFTAALKATPMHNAKTDELKAILDRAYAPAPARTAGPLIDANVKQASNRLTTAYAKWFDSMDDATQAAFVQYEKDSGGALNTWLRAGMPQQTQALTKALGLDLEAELAALDKAIAGGHLPDQQVVVASSKLDKPLTVYRGRGLDVVPEVGDLVSDPAFMSTTIDPAQAAAFATAKAGKQPVVYRIALPKGQKAAWLDGYFGDAYAYEEEMLLPRGQAFHVVGKHADEVINGETVTVLDLVPEPAPLIPVGPAIAADDINAWAPLDPQEYALPGGGPLLNEPMKQWTGYVPPEPEAPPLKTPYAKQAELRKEWDAAKLTYKDVATGHTDLAISWTATDDKEAVKLGLVTGKGADGTYLVAKDQAALDDALAYLADKAHTADDDAFWKMLGYDAESVAKFDAYEAAKSGKRLTAGVMIVEPDGRMWVLAPKNKFAGYENTVIKGGVDEGETTAAAAIREVREEAGMSVELDSFIGDYANSDNTAVTRMYVGHRTGGGPLYAAEKETFRVRLLTADEAKAALTRYGKPDGRDQAILADTVAQVLGKPASIDHIIPAADMETFHAATAPLPTDPPAVGLDRRPIVDQLAFSRDARAAMTMPPSSDFGYDHETVLGLSNVVSYPPSTKFPIASEKWLLPSGDEQKMYWKTEAHGAGQHVFWMNSKKQIEDPAQRLNVHVAQLLRFSDQITDPAIVAFRVNDALLDQVPALRDILMAGGATKPTPGTTELTMSQLHALAATIKTEVPLTPAEALIPTAELAPTPVTKAAAGYDLKATSELLSTVTHDPAAHEFKWITKHGVAEAAYTVSPATQRIVVQLIDVPASERIDVLRAQIALLAPMAKAEGFVIRLNSYTIAELDLEALYKAIPGAPYGGGYHVGWEEAEKLHDEMLHDLTAMGHQPGALVDGTADMPLAPVAGIVEPTKIIDAHVAELTPDMVPTPGVAGGETRWRKADGSIEGRWGWLESGNTITLGLGLKAPTANAAARQLALLADLTELHPKFEKVVFLHGSNMPKALLTMLDPAAVANESITVTAEQLQGIRNALFPQPILSHLPTIAPGPLPEQLSYKVADVIPLTATPTSFAIDTWTADLGGGRIGEWQTIAKDVIVRDWKVGGDAGTLQDALGQLGFLYDRAGVVSTTPGLRLLVPESKFDPDVVASLVAVGGQRKAGYVVMDSGTAKLWQANVIPSEPAAAAIVGPAAAITKAEATPLLAMIEHVDDKPATWLDQAMKNSAYDETGHGIVWRRWSNTLEIHDVNSTSDVAIKAHLVRLAAAADAAPKISALRITLEATSQMSDDLRQLLLDAGGKAYPGGLRMTADDLKALRAKLLDDAKTLAGPAPDVSVFEKAIADVKAAGQHGSPFDEEEFQTVADFLSPTGKAGGLHVTLAPEDSPSGEPMELFGWYDQGKLVAVQATSMEGGAPYFHLISVAPGQKGHGYGTKLLDWMQDSGFDPASYIANTAGFTADGYAFSLKWLEHRIELAKKLPEAVAAPPEPVLLSAKGVADIAPLTYTKTELKYFDQYDWTQPDWASPVRVTQRRLAKEILWARTTGAPDVADRFAASIRHVIVVAEQIAADPKIERLRIENLQQLPETFRLMLKSLSGVSATDAVMYVPAESLTAFAKQLEADLGYAVVAAVPAPASEADLGILGIAGHDDIELNALSGIHGTTEPYVSGITKTTYYEADSAIVYTTTTPYTLEIAGLDASTAPNGLKQAVFLHALDEMAVKADADGKTLSIASYAFSGSGIAGQDIKAKLLELGAQMDGSNVVIPKNMLIALSNHIQTGKPLVFDATQIVPAVVNPASAGAKLSAQFGLDHAAIQTAVATPSPWHYSDGTIGISMLAGHDASVSWQGTVHTPAGIKLAIADVQGVAALHIEETFLSAVPAILGGLPVAGPDGLLVKAGITTQLDNILLAIGGQKNGIWIELDQSALVKLANHIDEDKALRVVPQGSAASNAPLAVAIDKPIDVANIFGLGEEPALWINGSHLAGSKVNPMGGVDYNYVHGEAPATNRLLAGALTWTKADVTTYVQYDNEAVRAVIVAHLYQTAKMAETGGISSFRVANDVTNVLPGGAWNAVRDVLDELGGKMVSTDAGLMYDVPLDGLAKFRAAVDNQLLGKSVGITGIAPEAGLGYAVADYDKALSAWNKAEPVFSFGGFVGSTETVAINGHDWTLTLQNGVIMNIAPAGAAVLPIAETSSAIAAGLVHHLQAVADIGAEAEDVGIAADVFDHVPHLKQAIIDAIGPEAVMSGGDVIIPLDFLDGTMQTLANPLAAVATPEPIAAIPSPVAAAPGPSKLAADYGLDVDSLSGLHDLLAVSPAVETQLTYGFTNTTYIGAYTIKNRLSGKTLTWESLAIKGAGGEGGKLAVGIEHIAKMADVLAANPNVKVVRFFKPEQMPDSWKKLLVDHGAIDVNNAGGQAVALELTTLQFDTLKHFIDTDLAGKGISAPVAAAVPATPVPTQAFHTLHGIEDDALASIDDAELLNDSWKTWYTPAGATKETLNVAMVTDELNQWSGKPQKKYVGKSAYSRQQKRILWTDFTPAKTWSAGYGSEAVAVGSEAQIAAAGYRSLQRLAQHAVDTNVPLVVKIDAARAAGVTGILKDAGSIKTKFGKHGDVIELDVAKTKALLAKIDADVATVVEPIPAPAAAAVPPPAPAAVVAPVAPPAIVEPVGPPKISSTYGYDGPAVSEMTAKPDAHLVVQSGGSTPHGEVYVDHWTIPTTGATAKVRWAEEKFGDAYILHVRDVVMTGQGSAANTALVSSLAKTIRDRIAASNGKFSSVLIDNKAMSQQMADMLVAAGGKQTKGYIRLTATQIETLSGEVAKDTASWVGQAVVSAAGPVPKVSGVVLPKGAPTKASPSFIYGYDPTAVAKHLSADAVSTPDFQVATVDASGKTVMEPKTLIHPITADAGISWSVSPSGKAVGIFSVVSTGDPAATRDAVFAMVKKVADEAVTREKLFVKPEMYDAVPGLRQMLLDAGGVETSYPKLGTAIQMTSDQAASLSAAIATDTMGKLKVSISSSADYLKFDANAFQSLVLDPPKPLVGGHAWRPTGATSDTQAIVTLANDGRRAEWKGLVGGVETTNPLVAAAELNWLAEQGVEELRVGMQVIAAAPLFDKFLLANGAKVSGNELVLDAKAINAARIHLTKDALPVLLGGKALSYSVIDEMAANGAMSIEAAAHFTLSPKGTSQLMRTAIGGIESTATIVRSDANILWRESAAAGMSAGQRRAAAVAHLRNMLNWSAQDVGIRRFDIGTAVLRDVPNLRAVLEKYGATEVTGSDGYLSLDRARVLKLRTDIEKEFAEISPGGATYIGQQAASIQWPAADELTEVKVGLTGQTAKNVFTDSSGNQWLFKPGASGRGAATDKAVAELAQLLGLNVPPVRHYSLTVDGKVVAGSLQKMLPGAKSIKAISDLTPTQQAEMLRHSVLDWLTNNDDAHIGNWLIDDNGRMWSIDKSRSWSTLNDGLHDTLRTDNEGNGGGTPLLFKFWRDVKRDPSLLRNVKPQDLAPVLRTLRNMSDTEFRRIVEPVAAVTNRGKYAGKPDAMVKAMLDRKNSVVTDFERYFKGEIDAAIRTNSAAVPDVWRTWAKNGGTFNLDATPVDLLTERLTEREARWGDYTPAKFQQLAQDNAFSKVRSEVHSYYDGGTSGSGSHYGAELIRPRLNPKAEQDWRELNEWATLSIILKDQAAVHDALGYGIEVSGLRSQADLLRKFFNRDNGTVRLVRSTNRYRVGGRADVPSAYVDGMAKDGIRNLTGYALGKHVVIQAHGGVYYYSDVDPSQLFTWWGLGHGAGAGESEILVSDVRPDQVIAIRPQSKPLPSAGLGYEGPLIESLVAALVGMLIEA